MKVITIHRVSIQFDAGSVAGRSLEETARNGIELLNEQLRNGMLELNAQIFAAPDEIEVEERNE